MTNPQDYKIRELKNADIEKLRGFPPSEWNVDFVSYLDEFQGQEYFYAMVLTIYDQIIGTGNPFAGGKIGMGLIYVPHIFFVVVLC